MKTYLGKRQRLRLAALVVGGLLCSTTANAANLVSTIPSDYGNSEMGTVTGSRVTTNIDATPQAGVLKNLNRDPASFGFHQKGKSMILLRQYTYSTTELENTSLIDPNSAGAAASAATGKTTAVPNMHAAAASDEYIYMTGYDLGQIGVVRQNGKRLMENKRAVVNLKNDIKQYCGYNFTETFKNLDEDSKGEKGKTYTGDPAKAQVHGEALLVDGRRLYVAASVNPLAGYDPYDDGFLMQYDIQDDGTLKFGSYTRISRNIDQGRLNKFNDHILVSCIGGDQHYNGTGNTHYTALNIAKIDQNTGRILGTEQRRASIPNHVKGTGEDMRDLKLLPDGTAYVMTYNLSPSGSQINAHVYKTTMSNLMSEHPDDWQEVAVASQQEGWFGKLNAEYYTKRLWLELGDTLQAYTDGDDTAKHIWQAKDFSDNKAFNRFNKITMIEPDRVYGNTASVVMTLPAELGGDTTAAMVNENAVWKNSAAFSDTITTQQSWNIDTVVSIGKDKLGDKSTNVLAAISATDSRPLNINAGENILQLQVENTVGNPTGIYARGADLTVSAKKGINILTRGSEGGNSLTNAVQLDALKNKATKLTINGPLNISMTGGLGGNGVAIQKSDRFGEKSYEARLASAIRINGNLKIAGTETDKWGIPLNRENVFSRFNNAGILTQVEKSDVTVDGDVDMTVYGNGVTTNAKDSSVHIAGGGSIQVPAGMRYSYYALAAYQGAISMNMGDDGTKPGNLKEGKALADVKLDGDLFALPTGRLDVALMTDKSYLHGLVDNGGTANLYLQNGAKWLNEARNERYYQDNEDMGAGTMAAVRTRAGGTVGKVYNAQSHVTNFVGGATEAQRGIIYQKNANPLTIDKYSGHTAAVYSHDIETPTLFKGGEIIIKKANADTKNVFTLFTDGAGVTTGNQSAVLNALANKLSYQSFAENKLLGKLSIGESLTTSTINGEITFGNETGSYAGGTTPPKPPSTEQTKTEFTKRLFGTASDQEYVDANVRQPDGTYRFSKDSNISYANTDDEDAGVISPTEDVKIDASGHTLTVETKVQGAQKSAAIKNTGKKLNITADALRLFTNKHEVSDAIFSWGILNESGTTNISGLTEIDTTGYNSSRAVEATEGTVTLEGLKAKVAAYDDAAALFTGSTGQIHVNAKDGSAGNKTVKIDGNVGAMGEASRIDVAMVNKDSGVNGLAFGKGKINFWLQNGAVWNNEQYGGTVPDKEDNQLGYDYDYTFAGSRLSSLRGGNDANNAGVIFQKNNKDITIDNYSGHTRVFYEHDSATPTTIKGGDFRIKNAAVGSGITLTTDSSGLNTESTKATDKNLVSATLNALANKLWYTAYTTNERNLTGKVEIAEGLTSSSASKRLENITFDAASGQGRYVYTPQSEATTDPIKESETLSYDRQALATAPNTKGGRIVSGLYTDNTAYDKQHPMVVDMNGHSLHIEANSKNQIASAIHGGNNKYIRIVNSGEKKSLTIKASNTDTRAANGIQTEANGHIHIQGPVVIEDVHTKGYNAAAIQTNGTIGSPSDVTIDGDLTVQSVRADRVDTKNKGADDGRNLAALKTTADESKITVKGNVDIQNIKGSVLQTIGADSVIDVGGGTISAAEDADHTKQYRAVRAEKGTVNINTPEGVSGSRKTNITGDMYITREYGKKVAEYSGGQLVDFDRKGVLNVSLTTADSSWTGAATYDVNRADFGTGGFTAHDVGQFNLTLQNGAHWTNEQRSGVTDKWLGSRLSSLRGGNDANNAGVIFQKNNKDITIDNYSGHTHVFYEHDAATPTTIKGGDFRIKNAAAGSAITLTTDSTGLNTESTEAADKNLVSATLNALANKLWYTAYTTNERNLTGKAEIAEGLTTSSASKRVENITFNESTGQGSYVYTPQAEGQTKTEFTKRLFGTTSDQEYIDAHVRQADGTYRFTKDSTITYQNGSNMNRGAIKPNADVQIDAADRVLTVKSGGKSASVKESAAISNDGKDLDIAAKTLKLLVNDTTSAAPLQSAWGIRTTGGTTEVTGTTEIDVAGTKESKAVHASGGTVTLGSLHATTNAAAEEAAALYAQNNGRINVNMNHNNGGTGTVTLDGHIVAKDAASRVDAAIYGTSSHLKGFVYGEGKTNLWLQNGGVWENEKRGANVPTGFTGSHVSQLTGGGNASRAGLIFQRDERKITIDKYLGHTKVFFAHDAATPTNIKGGDIDIKSAVGGSSITLVTDQSGLNTSTTAGITEKNLVSATLNALANKLWYTGYATNERNLLGKVQIAEGLTASSASKRLENITFDTATGQGSYVYTPLINPPASQTQSDFTTAITGDEVHDTPYTNAGVRKPDGQYIFTKDSTITTGKDLIAAGAWMSNISAAVSNASTGKTLDINLNGKNLAIKTVTDVSTTGITAIGKDSKVNIKNAGAISIDAESTGGGQTATLFVNGGGAIHIQNGGGNLEDKVLKVRANGNHKTNVAVIKSMNGVTGVESNITIDGLVDVLADGNDAANGKGANEGVSAVASTIDIGGGTIRAINGAWAAIRAYGEFVSDNYGTVNFNVTKGADGLANGADTNRAVIEGDIVTNGGMGTKGRVSVGLSTANSHWIGNYADTRGYGVTPGALGAVNLFMKNGSYWKGFSNGTMKVEMSGADTSWTGFNLGDNMQLKLSDGAIWHNAITQEQKNQDGKAAISKVKYFTGEGGFIDMTGTNRFLASSNSLSGAPVQTGSSSIEEKGLGETGDLTIDEFSGSTTMLYRHDVTTPTTIYGGKLTIGKAAAGSLVRMLTDNTGLNTESAKSADKNLVSATLNALANKLWYTAYTTGERNLTGKAEIAEGLTTSSASKRVENITFNESTGQGGYAYTPAVDPPKPPQPGQDEQTTTEFTKPLIGTDSDQEYIDAHVRQADGTYRFTKDSTITYQNNVSGARGAIMPSADVHINAADRVLTIKSGSGIASVTQGAAIANYGKGLDIKAKTLKLLVNGTTSAAPLQTAWGILSTGGTTNISGMTEIDVAGTERSKAVQAYDGTVTLEGLRAKANAASKDAVTLDVQGTGRINVNVKDGTVGSSEVMLDGNITARESGSRVDAALTTGTSYLKGLVSGVGTLNLWLQNGAVWHNEEYTTQPTGFSSRLSNFTGGSDASRAGVIFQKNNNDISIDNYSGYARVFYKHDAGTPTTIIGGDLRIKNAAAGSNITLATDNAGLNTESTKAADKNLVSATLNALANKLWYTAYTTGERNLTGKAEIAEGLTTSSASKRVENITFNESTGQGGYAYTPAVDPPKPPQPGQDEQTTTEFTTPITGDAASDADYVAGHVLKNDTYTFTKNSKITAATGIQAVQNKPIKVQAAGAELKIQAADYGVDAGANSKVAITGKQLTIDAGSRSIRAAAGSDVSVAAGFDLKGAIENNGGRISLKDMGRKSSLVGDITQTAGSFNLRMQGVDSNLKGNIIASGGVLDLSMEGAGATFTGSIRGAGSAREAGTGDRRLTLENRTVWNVTSPSNLTRLNAKQGSVINYLFSHNEGVNVENFKGSATVHYNGTATSDGTLTLANTGKFRIRNVDGTGNALTIATDAHGGSDTADERVAKTLARQFEYVSSSSNIQNQRIRGLSLSALIADGLVSSSKRYNILMEADGTSGDVKPFVSNIEYGDYETKLMKGVKSAMTASTMAWRAEANDLMKRMGDLRLSPNDTGIWARVYRGKSTSNKDNTDFRMNYSTIQVGCDKKVGRDWRVGVAGSYMSGSSAYAAGNGKNKEGNLGVYGTWTGKSGQYVDLIAKIGRLQNEYTVYNDFGHYVKGDYSMWGGSLSAEYGKRISMKDGSFVEPQIELIYSHMQGTNYVGSTDYSGMSMYVHQKPFDSFIGRIGFGFGKETERSTYYARASLYHEFAGDMHTDYSDGFTPKSTMQRGKDTWVGVQLGGTLKLSDKTNLYGNFEKTFGGDVKTDWRMDAGVRWSF
ncbi:autotransporter outer membrane beta-barrel domain-containing protein [uncultured Selenomonas sp.]|uniref:autotransporter outer membrane beta-barrel domain-containing protein n=1 Tax=uncultured Selenomonas sp. TaxID=159275 RepID=UPI002805D65D|nr:autotransporter outer membrane beta-barrel domain-containing protein [uncultured Selenomonas sp.]